MKELLEKIAALISAHEQESDTLIGASIYNQGPAPYHIHVQYVYDGEKFTPMNPTDATI